MRLPNGLDMHTFMTALFAGILLSGTVSAMVSAASVNRFESAMCAYTTSTTSANDKWSQKLMSIDSKYENRPDGSPAFKAWLAERAAAFAQREKDRKLDPLPPDCKGN